MFKVLRTNRDIRLLFIGDNISIIGDYFTYIALAGLIKDYTGSNFLVALVYVAFTIPSFFISPIAGPIIDRFDRKKVLITVHLLQAVSAVGFLFTSKDRIWVGLVAQVLITCLSAFVTPAVNAAVPNLAKDPEELRQANALFGSSWGAMTFAGAAVGGFFSEAFGRTATFVTDIASFVVAAGLIAFVTRAMQAERTTEHSRRIRPLADMREAFHVAKEDHVILALIASKTTFAIGAGAVSQLAVFASDVFGKGDGGRGLLLAARGAGSALGPIFAMRYARGNLARVVTVCGMAGFVFSLSYLGASVAPSILVACGFIAVAHFGGGAQWTLSTFGLQMRSPDEMRGRIIAGDFALVTLMMSVTSASAGVLSDVIGVRVA
ncbi:MAG: MFS transporter, partial [Actinobacteria bacterium]|nr:MFS transporter [Actinomycetota bacterium]